MTASKPQQTAVLCGQSENISSIKSDQRWSNSLPCIKRCGIQFSPCSAEVACVSRALQTGSVKYNVQVLHSSDVRLPAYEMIWAI